ncbi:SIS domain-containing protein [Atopobacter sp. AH10]|uniref:SIS domain-containing protein n=1 Tax=Atopobacter sp. AH10 TaxID=2315861 RepID=UPI000EF240BA|nr:SIS domain-containing protein [Atopobacter sp. AH10]RLK62749.1 SIS domain-containing protein [Atopobacter sp. AH10]
MFKASKEELERLKAEITTREIKQQPELWQEALAYYQEHYKEIHTFLDEVVGKDRTRVIFTGAGTSAYVGDTIYPYLKEVGDEDRYEFLAVPTTSLVSNPYAYFKADKKTILVSFARSGNSPESVASVELGKQLVKDFYQITITCAKDGKLAQQAHGDRSNLLLMMPERSNDQGFAMTGSYTCMTLTALLIFDQHTEEDKENYVHSIVDMGQEVIAREDELLAITSPTYDRVIYLGSGAFEGLAREVQLKILELTAGQIATAFDSSMGFRHGPKSFVNERSLAFVFISNNPYTRQYDVDIYKELAGDQIAEKVIAIGVEPLDLDGEKFVFKDKNRQVPDAYMALPFAILGQTIALLTSIKVGNKPDTPSPTGTVNRVVKGVSIHPYQD